MTNETLPKASNKLITLAALPTEKQAKNKGTGEYEYVAGPTLPALTLTIAEVLDQIDKGILTRSQAFQLIYKNERPTYFNS